jgi:hypothetical protein
LQIAPQFEARPLRNPKEGAAAMKKHPTLVGAVVVVCLAVAWAVRAQTLTGPTGTVSIPASVLALLNAIPPPPDDPLLDSSGNAMMDSSGHPISDPNEQFHQVKPAQFDPAHTYLVQAAWLNSTGCPTNAIVATYPSTSPTGPFTDAACPNGDPRDQHNEGLLLAKTGPTTNNASAVAELKKVRGTLVTSVGYDIRKQGGSASPLGSHCGAGAPRFLIIGSDGSAQVIGCNSPPPAQTTSMTGWSRLRWPVAPMTAERILIIFDEGQDPSGGPDQFGAAFLDNIAVNEQMVGAGPTDAR